MKWTSCIEVENVMTSVVWGSSAISESSDNDSGNNNTHTHIHTHLGSLSYQYQRLWCVSSLFWGMTSGNPFYQSFNISLLNSKHISKHTLAFKTEQTAYKVCILFSLSLCLSLTHAHTRAVERWAEACHLVSLREKERFLRKQWSP